MGINSWVAHANRSIYGEDADDFRPERWLQDEATVSQIEQYFFSVSEIAIHPYDHGKKAEEPGTDWLRLAFQTNSSAADLAHV